MTPHNEYIDMVVNTLKGEIRTHHDAISEISTVIGVLNSIKLDDGNLPIDNSLGTQITEDRRQQIYTHCMAKADMLIPGGIDNDDEDTNPNNPTQG